MFRHIEMGYELDKVEVFHLSQLKALKENETPIFQKYCDTLDRARETIPGRELDWSERKLKFRKRQQRWLTAKYEVWNYTGLAFKRAPILSMGGNGQEVYYSVSSDQMSINENCNVVLTGRSNKLLNAYYYGLQTTIK